MILVIRTDKSESELALYDGSSYLESFSWDAGRALSTAIHKQIDELLSRHGQKLANLGGLVIFKGPGSFTGLRIGFSVANSLAYGLDIPIVSNQGDDWAQRGVARIAAGENEKVALPDYGGPAHTTTAKK